MTTIPSTIKAIAPDGRLTPARRRRLMLDFYARVSELAIPGFIARSPDNVEVDILCGDAPWLDEALRHPETDAAGYPVIGLPYLVLMKLASARAQDMADLARMLGLASEARLAQVRDVVRRYAPDEVEDLEALIYLRQLEASA